MKAVAIAIFVILSVSLVSQNPKGARPIAGDLTPDGNAKQTYAVVVGISDYQEDGIPDLRYADKDALAFADFLRSPAGGSLDDDHLHVLLNEQATMGKFAMALTWLMEETSEGDKAIIYFSGHGDVENKSVFEPGFLLCWDAPTRVYLSGGSISLANLKVVITSLSVGNNTEVVVITDACRSGKLSGRALGGTHATALHLAQQYANETKILSCQPDEYSIEGEQWGGGRGAFSYHLVNALYGMADRNADLNVTLSEVDRYLEDHVTPEVAPVSQIPSVIGNKTVQLSRVDPFILKHLQKDTSEQQSFSAIESKGLEEDVLASVDTNILRLYLTFEQALTDKVLLKPKEGQPDGACADAYYRELEKVPALQRLHPTIRRNYAAALIDDTQQTLNNFLKVDLQELNYSREAMREKCQPYPSYLARAAEILTPEHYMYPELIARKLLFEGYIMSLAPHFLNKKEREQILNKYTQALSWQPRLPHAYLFMSRIFAYAWAEPDSAEIYAIKASELAPSWVLPFSQIGFLFSKSQDQQHIDKAKYFLKEANAIDSNHLSVLNAWGAYYTDRQQYDKAEKYLKKSILIDSSYFGSYNNLGHLYLRSRRYLEAEQYLKKCIEIDSTHANVYANLGFLFWEDRRLNEAATYFEKCINQDSVYFYAYAGLGDVYKQLGRYSDAERQIKKAMNLNPKWAWGYQMLGGVYKAAQRYSEAEEMIKIFIEKSPNEAIVGYLRLVSLYQLQERWEESLAIIEKAMKSSQTDASLYGQLGNAYTHIPGRLEDAELAFKKLLEFPLRDWPDILHLEDYIHLAHWHWIKNQSELAWQYLEQGLEKGFSEYNNLQLRQDLHEMRKETRWNVLMDKYFPDKMTE